MFWTYCTLTLSSTPEQQHGINEFEVKHGLPGSPFSLSTAVPVGLLPSDEDLLKAWGCVGPADVIEPWNRRTPTWGFIRFRTPGGPPTSWLRSVAPLYPLISVSLLHTTEATAVCGRLSCTKKVWTTSEVEGDIARVEQELSIYLR